MSDDLSILPTLMGNLAKMLRRQGFNVGDPEPGKAAQGLVGISQFQPAQLEMLRSFFMQSPSVVQQKVLEEDRNPSLRSLLSQLVESYDGKDRRLIYFAPAARRKTTSIKQVRMFEDLLAAFGCQSGLLVISKKLSREAKDYIYGGVSTKKGELPPAPLSTRYNISVYEDETLLYDPTESEWVPRCEILTPEQAQSILVHDKINPIKMPRILMTDAIGAWLGLKKGQLLLEENSSFLPSMLVDKEIFLRRGV